jgi:hypothetical protein
MASHNHGPYASLERLPLLALEEICGYLSYMGTRRRSLFAFSQVSKICCDAAKRERFERITFVAENDQQMDADLTRARRVLAVDGRSCLVRRVKTIGRLNTTPGWRSRNRPDARPISEPEALGEAYGFDAFGEDDQFFKLRNYLGYVESRPECTEENKSRANRSWRPLADFLSILPGLKHLIWASIDQVPRCVLDTLHASLPRTRLHVHSFSLRSLYTNLDEPHNEIDPDEFVLASSPNLYSVCAVVEVYDEEESASYNEEALQEMIGGITPNLRCASIIRYDNILFGDRPPRPEIFPCKQDVVRQAKGRLEKLVLGGTEPKQLLEWAAYTDLSKLRTLRLLTKMYCAYFAELTEMAEQNALSNLETLTLCVHEDYLGMGEDRGIEGDEALINSYTRFLSALPPLSRLCVPTPLARATKTGALARHGASLQRLQLGNILSLGEIQQIQHACPNLRHLRIGLCRSLGDEREVAAYRALGSIPRLETLTLSLYYTWNCSWEEHSDQKRTVHRMRCELTNAAIDAELARAIFNTIFTANGRTRPGTIPAFHHLEIAAESGQFHNWSSFPREVSENFSLLRQWVARSWSCEREQANVECGKVLVRQFVESANTTELVDSKLKIWEDKQRTRSLDKELVILAWCKIWPKAQGRIDWMRVWHSTPLALES